MRSAMTVRVVLLAVATGVSAISPGHAAGPGCPPDSVASGGACIDTYEASVWETTDPKLVVKIRAGIATVTDLLNGGAIQHGALGNDYGPGCPDTGSGCKDFYAVSVAGVVPARFITWFQAVATARNAGKRLPTNAEWQAAALGTPDPGTDDGTTDCNITPTTGPVPTGTRGGCISDIGAFDLVGNVHEWVASWLPRAASCIPALFPDTGDINCTSGVTLDSGPGAVVRGGSFIEASVDAKFPGVFSVRSRELPSSAFGNAGFRGIR